MISMVQDMAGQIANKKFQNQPTTLKFQGLQQPQVNSLTNKENGPVKTSANRGIQTKNFLSNATGIDIDLAGGVKGAVDSLGRSIERQLVPQQAKYAVNAVQSVAANPPPPEPKTPAQLAQEQQQKHYAEYMQNLPRYQQQMQERLGQQANRGMYENMRNVEQRNLSRGLGYGGLNEGMKAQAQAQSQQDLANQITNANVGLLDLGNQLQSGAIGTGLGNQADLQQRLNQIYQQQQAQYNAQNQTAGSQMGLLANLAMMAALV